MTASPTVSPSAGPSAIGPYLIERELGRGAMSVVYRGVGPRGDEAAVKVMRAELLASGERESVLARFRREAEIGMRLNHPNVVRVFDHGGEEASPYLAMELIRGRELKDYMHGGSAQPLPRDRAVAVLCDMLEALDYVHRNGVIHRDIKPGNIVLDQSGTPKLTDFGIAREPDSDLTQSGEMLGTPAFIAPELLHGGEATARSDVFSAGVLAYYLLTGHRPFSGTVASVMRQILFDDPPRPSTMNDTLPAVYDAPLLKALRKDPEERTAGAALFARELADALSLDVGARNSGASPEGAATTRASSAVRQTSAAEATPVSGDNSLILDDLTARLRALVATPLSERVLAGIEDDLVVAQRATDAAKARLVDILTQHGVAALTAPILAGMPAPGKSIATNREGGRHDFMLLIRLLATIGRTLTALGEGRRAIPESERVAAALGDAFTDYAHALEDELAADDNPDVMRLSANFLRLDVLLHGLEELGAGREVEGAQATLGKVTGLVMDKINGLLRACTEENDGFARFGVSLILSDVEDLIDIARRALEAGGALEGGGADQHDPGKHDRVRDFVRLTTAFGDLSLKELRAGLNAGTLAGEVFAAKLRPVGALHQLATRLPPAGIEAELRQLTDTLHGRMNGLMRLCVDPATTHLTAEDRRERLAEIHEMADALGWRELARAAMAHISRL